MVSTILKSIRLPFLLLTLVCIFLAASLVTFEKVNLDFMVLFLALVAALFAHISVNALNEYLDYTSGLDNLTQKTPFSGGSGALPDAPQMKNWVLFTAILSLLVTITIGIFFSYFRGPWIFAYGSLGIFLVIAYTRCLNKYPIPCLIAPGLGFGTIMVTGCHFALAGMHTPGSILAGLMVFFLSCNLLLLNQLPDIEADKQVGRNHLPIRYGVEVSAQVYGLFSVLAFLTLILALISKIFPWQSAYALLPLAGTVYCYLGTKKYGKTIARQQSILAANTLITLVTPVILGLSLIV